MKTEIRVFAFILSVLASPAFADLETFNTLASGNCPSNEDLDGRLARDYPATYFRQKIQDKQVFWRGIHGRADSTLQIDADIKASADAFETVYMLSGSQDDERVLIQWPGLDKSGEIGARCAWVSPSVLVKLQKSGRDEPAVRPLFERELFPNGSPLVAHYFATNAELEGRDDLPVRNMPWPDGDIMDYGLSPFERYVVYETTTERVDGSTSFLVGLHDTSDGKAQLLGWAREADLQHWHHRIVVGPSDNGAMSCTFENKASGKSFPVTNVGLGTTFRDANPSLESERAYTRVVTPKFPLLSHLPRGLPLNRLPYDTAPGFASVTDKQKAVERMLDRSHAERKFWKVVDEIEVAYGLASASYQQDVGEFIRLAKALDTVEIAFVVDATKSMGDYRVAVVDAIKEVRLTDPSINVNVGLLTYGDYKNKLRQSPDVNGLDVQFIQMQPISDFIRAVKSKNFRQTADAVKDKEEPSSAALIRAIRDMDWSDDVPAGSVRYIFHIGDHGTRRVAQTFKGHKSSRQNDYYPDNVASVLLDWVKDGGIRPNYTGIAVKGARSGSENTRFVDDARSIHTSLKDDPDLLALWDGVGEAFPAEPVGQAYDLRNYEGDEAELDALSREVGSIVLKSFNHHSDLKKYYAKLLSCATGQIACKDLPNRTPFASGFVSEDVLALPELRILAKRIAERRPTVGSLRCENPGMAANGKPAFKLFLALSNAELLQLGATLAESCRQGISNAGALEKLRVQLQISAAGADVAEDAAQSDEAGKFIPGWLMSPLFGLTQKDADAFFKDLRSADLKHLSSRVHEHVCTARWHVDNNANNFGLMPGSKLLFRNDDFQEGFDPSILEDVKWVNEINGKRQDYYLPASVIP